MSHSFGSMCAEHRRVMSPDTCPERDCPGNHGYVDQPCDERCGDYEPTPVDYVLLGRLLAERWPRPQVTRSFAEWLADYGTP